MEELRPGLSWWEGRHPAWTEDQDWGPEVSSYAYESGGRTVLFDPAEPPAELRGADVLLTQPWHARSSEGLNVVDSFPGVESRPGCWPGDAIYWIPEHGALVFGDVIHKLRGELELAEGKWMPEGQSQADLKERLRALLDLPVELLLVTHGAPVREGARDELARLLA